MMKNKKLVFVFVAIILLLATMISCVKASDDLDFNVVLTNNQENANNNSQANNTAVENNTVNNTTNNIVPDTNKTTNNNTNTLPQTGVEDNTILFVAFIGIFAVSAIYAYKKIRDYKNI